MRFEMDKETIYLIKLGTKEDDSFISFCLNMSHKAPNSQGK